MKSSLFVASSLLIALAARPALADPSAEDKLAAQSLFDAALKAIADGKVGDGCAKLEASQRLDPALGTTLYLADCYERAGRIATAWVTFKDAAAAARAAGQGDREQRARARIATLEPRLFRVTIVAPAIDGLVLKRNGVTLKTETLGVPIPLDPGKYVFEATAPGRAVYSVVFEVPAQAGEHEVRVPELTQGQPTTPGATPSAAPSAPPPAPTLVDKPQPKPDSSQRVIGVVVGAAGLVTLGVSGLFAGLAVSKNKDAAAVCTGAQCATPDGETLSKSALAHADRATGFLIAGSVVTAAGLVIFITAPSNGQPTTAIAPVVSPNLAGASIWRSF